MTPLEQLKAILHERYVSEDGDEYKVVLKPGLPEQQIEKLAATLPAGHLPAEIRELLQFAGGIEVYGFDEISFAGYGAFEFENVFPNPMDLTQDGAGNFWIVDIDDKGNWGHVFFVCHDPAVVVKNSENLAEFILHIHESGKYGSKSNLSTIQDKVTGDIWVDRSGGFIEVVQARQSDDPVLAGFASQLPDNFVVADLRGKPNQTGFAWGKYGPDTNNAVRYKYELLWGFEKKEKKGFLSKLFGR